MCGTLVLEVLVHQELAMLVQPHTSILELQTGHVAAAAQRHEKRLGLESFAREELER